MNPSSEPGTGEADRTFGANPHVGLADGVLGPFAGRWVSQDTAILAVHGIGNPQPLDTLDQFARTLVETCREAGHVAITMTHYTAAKPRTDGGFWHDNFIRLSVGPEQPHVDIYEYYWANHAQDKASVRDIQNWVTNVSSGARRFYRDNAEFGREYGDSSSFFAKRAAAAAPDPRSNFRPFRYWFFLTTVAHVIPVALGVVTRLLRALSRIPIAGWGFDFLLHWAEAREVNALVNVISEVTIYNTTDANSRFYAVRKAILDGAVNALRYLLEPAKREGPYRPEDWRYDRVILAGHSLGSQISFDAVNRLNHLVHQGELRGCDTSGYFTDGTGRLKIQSGTHISDMFCGLITFGSPLDKMAFFFRERTGKDQYLRAQLVEHFHGFKQRPWSERAADGAKRLVPAPELFSRLFDDIRWRNYYDRGDVISGSLDYYQKVVNVDCRFRPALSLQGYYVVLALCVAMAAVVGLWMVLLFHPGQWLQFLVRGTAAEFMTRLGQLSAPDVWSAVVCALLLTASAAVPLAAFAARFTHSHYWTCRRMFADIIREFLLPAQPLRHEPQPNGRPAVKPAGEKMPIPDFPCAHFHRADA